MPLRITFARLCRETRARLGLTQQQLGEAVGVTRGYIAKVESAKANPTFAIAERIAIALDLETDIVGRVPTVIGDPRQRDLVHARCSGYTDRRLRTAGWLTRREVEIRHAHSHGWIDLLAFDPATGTLIIIEIKTRLDDVGAIERQLGWYERSAFEVARRLGWHPRRAVGWLLVLASDEVDVAIKQNKDLLERAFPARSRSMSAVVGCDPAADLRRGLAMIDPSSKRTEWLRTTRVDGRRSSAPFRDYADAARRMSR
ncbi:MAG: helix-turn-helix domain-containing protein [Chloroflexota bacterium]